MRSPQNLYLSARKGLRGRGTGGTGSEMRLKALYELVHDSQQLRRVLQSRAIANQHALAGHDLAVLDLLEVVFSQCHTSRHLKSIASICQGAVTASILPPGSILAPVDARTVLGTRTILIRSVLHTRHG